jgi:hypothetical protein
MRVGDLTPAIGVRMHKSHLAMVAILIATSCAMRSAPLYHDRTESLEAALPIVSREDLLNELSLYYGAPYKEGGTSLTGVDCSGMVRVVFGSLGVKMPRTTLAQFGSGMSVGRKDVRTGDLIFFGRGGSPSHVGIAVSNREMVHSSSSRGVILDDIGEFSNFMALVGIRRVVRLR